MSQENPSGELSGGGWKFSPELLSRAYLCYEVNQLPDAWGNFSRLCKLPQIVLRWENANGKKAQTAADRRQAAWFWVNSNYVIDEDVATLQTIRIPLSSLVTEKLDSDFGINRIRMWRAEHNPPVLEIRNLRLEY